MTNISEKLIEFKNDDVVSINFNKDSNKIFVKTWFYTDEVVVELPLDIVNLLVEFSKKGINL
jgi:hypothetical protein